MYTITVKGRAETKHKNLAELDGIDCQDNFSEYFDKTSYSNDVSDGYMYFKYEEGKLMTYTVYNSIRELNARELEDLKDYTTGQWSDGIGEGFEQEPCMISKGKEVYISPWFYGQKVEVIQEKV